MWLVRTALRRPYTFVVMALLIAIGGVYSVKKTPTDIFPSINIPVVSVIWNYGGLPPEDMEKRIVNQFERFLTTIVSDIDHVESQSLTGIAVIKIYLQPGANVEQAIAQTTAVAQQSTRSMPPGTVPPLIMRYSATSVPIMQLAIVGILAPFAANSAGWIFTEMGRQPFVVAPNPNPSGVDGVFMFTAAAVSPGVTAGEMLFSLISLGLVYGALMVVELRLLVKYVRGGVASAMPELDPHHSDDDPDKPNDPDKRDDVLAFAY